MADKLKQAHAGVEHADSRLTVKGRPGGQNHIALRKWHRALKCLIQTSQLPWQFLFPFSNAHIPQAVNQGLSILSGKPLKELVCL